MTQTQGRPTFFIGAQQRNDNLCGGRSHQSGSVRLFESPAQLAMGLGDKVPEAWGATSKHHLTTPARAVPIAYAPRTKYATRFGLSANAARADHIHDCCREHSAVLRWESAGDRLALANLYGRHLVRKRHCADGPSYLRSDHLGLRSGQVSWQVLWMRYATVRPIGQT